MGWARRRQEGDEGWARRIPEGERCEYRRRGRSGTCGRAGRSGEGRAGGLHARVAGPYKGAADVRGGGGCSAMIKEGRFAAQRGVFTFETGEQCNPLLFKL